MTPIACESKPRSVVRSVMHTYPGNWVAIGRADVYYAWAAHTLSAGIKCRHCINAIFFYQYPTSYCLPSLSFGVSISCQVLK